MAKRKSNNGKALERLVYLLHQALKGDNTKIFHNIKIPYKIGKGKGQVDILIETNVDEFEYRTAVECKDFGKPVSAEKIDAFKSKCDRLINIDKRVIVTGIGFQSGAFEAAYASGVSLYTLSSVSEDIIKEWVNIQDMRQLIVEKVELDELQAITINEDIIKQDLLKPNSVVFLSNGEILPLHTLIKETEEQHRNNTNIHLVDKLMEGGLLNRIEETFPVKLYIYFGSSDAISIMLKTMDGKEIHIKKLELGLFYYCKLFQPYRIKDSRRYIDLIKENIKAETVSFEINNNNISIVKISGNDEPKVYITNKDGEFEELKGSST